MANIPVFLSYAHIDNEPLAPSEKGWVTKFHGALETRLRQLAGSDLKIWRDNLLAANEIVWEALEDRLDKGALLVSVLTPRYVRSDSCLRELRGYCSLSARRGGLSVRNRSRVFKVVKTPPETRDSLPAELHEVLEYPFFERDARGVVRELELDLDVENRRKYLDRLYDLAHDIQETLILVHGNDDVAPAPRGAVYLAETPYDLAPQRDELRRDLQQRGYEVLPARPVAWDAPDFRQAIRADLARSTLAIHLIGACAGIVPEGEEDSIVALQNGLAAEESAARFFPRLLWLPTGMEKPRQERHQAFVDRLLNGHADEPGLELLRMPLEELKTVLHDKLNAKAPADGKGKAPAASPGRNRVYLICHECDLGATGALREHLDGCGCDVDTPLFEGDEAERTQYHKELLQMSDGVLVFYGTASDAWLRFKLLDLRKAPGYRDPACAPLTQAVYVASPETPQKQQLKSHEPRLLRAGGEFSPAAVEPFLADLAQRRA